MHSQESAKKNFVAGCVNQDAAEEQCACSFEKQMEKYGYERWKEIITEINESNSTTNSARVDEFLEFISSSEMLNSCQ